MTPELAAKAAALSKDARRVLVALAQGPQQWRSVASIANSAGMTPERAKRACRELGPLVASYSSHTVIEPGYIVHPTQTALLAEAVRETPEPGHLLSGEE